MGSASSSAAIKNISDWGLGIRNGAPAAAARPHRKVTDDYGSLTFNEEVQRARLPKDVFRALRRAIAHGEALDPSVADIVASALKDWAVEHGATHYTHWFQPMTGITAEKHDSFLNPTTDGRAVAEFSGKELVRGEPDASSVPLRRHAIDLRSARLHRLGPDQPAVAAPHAEAGRRSSFPTAFVSWTGDALDKKTPLLRSMEALSKQAVRILRLFGSKAQRVIDDVRARAGILPHRPAVLFQPSRSRSTPAARSSARGRPRARRWKITTSDPSPTACWPS